MGVASKSALSEPGDRADLLAAVGRTSKQSLYRRFFAVKNDFTEPEIAFFLNIDFINHAALVAVLKDEGRPMIIGGALYRLAAWTGRGGLRCGRSVPGARYRHGAPAPLGDIGTRSRHSRVDRGGLARQHFNAESVREKWT
jgi:hypothetical protein